MLADIKDQVECSSEAHDVSHTKSPIRCWILFSGCVAEEIKVLTIGGIECCASAYMAPRNFFQLLVPVFCWNL